MRARIATLILPVLLGPACATVQEEKPPVRFRVGVHDVSLLRPDGWDHLDHGLEHRFHRGLSQISLADVGPVTPEGYLREIVHARDLYRIGQVEDAKAHLDFLNLRPAFPGARRWREFAKSWHLARDGGLKRNSTPYDVEIAYEAVLQTVERLKNPALDDLVERFVPSLDTGAHREIAETEPVEIDGRGGMRVRTWDRLSHDHRTDWLFVLNQENLLVLGMELGSYDDMKPAFESLAGSLEIHPRTMEVSSDPISAPVR